MENQNLNFLLMFGNAFDDMFTILYMNQNKDHSYSDC